MSKLLSQHMASAGFSAEAVAHHSGCRDLSCGPVSDEQFSFMKKLAEDNLFSKKSEFTATLYQKEVEAGARQVRLGGNWQQTAINLLSATVLNQLIVGGVTGKELRRLHASNFENV